MSTANKAVEEARPFFARDAVGDFFTLLALIGFFYLCMLLPLVGPAGATSPHAHANFVSFLVALMVAVLLASLGLMSKLQRRKFDQSPFPKISAGLIAFMVIWVRSNLATLTLIVGFILLFTVSTPPPVTITVLPGSNLGEMRRFTASSSGSCSQL